GRTLLTATEAGEVWLWDGATLRPRCQFAAGMWLTGVAFSPDSGTLATSSRRSLTQLWDAATGKPTGIHLMDRKQEVTWSIFFSPDGRKLITGSAPGAELWDRETGRLLSTWRGGSGINVAHFFPDGTKALLVTDGFAQVWDLGTGQVISSPRFRP